MQPTVSLHGLLWLVSIGFALLYVVLYYAIDGAKTHGKCMLIVVCWLYGVAVLMIPALTLLRFAH